MTYKQSNQYLFQFGHHATLFHQGNEFLYSAEHALQFADQYIIFF